MGIGLGQCPICGVDIHSKKNGIKPLGNYREVKIYFEDGSKMTAPCCMDCHDTWDEGCQDERWVKLMEYMEACLPPNWAEVKRASYMNGLKFKKHVLVKKRGALTAIEMKNEVRVWQ